MQLIMAHSVHCKYICNLYLFSCYISHSNLALQPNYCCNKMWQLRDPATTVLHCQRPCLFIFTNKHTLQMFTGVYGVSVGFPCNIYMETLYSSKGEIVYVVRKPCNIYTIFPFEEYRVSLWFLQPFFIDIAGKTYIHPVNSCKHFAM